MAFTFQTGYTQDDFTADNNVESNESSLEVQRKAVAEAAGVVDARFDGYADVLEVYNSRTDTERLADRRARHLAADPADQDFTRADDYTGNSTTNETTRTAD